MAFDSSDFLLLVATSAALFYAWPNAVWRQGVMLGASAAFIAGFAKSPIALWPVAAFVAAAVGAVHVAARRPKFALVGCLPALVLLFFVVKGYIGPGVPAGVVTAGLSYMLFRCLQVLSDIADETEPVTPPDAVTLIQYLTSFTTLVAGPIQRFDAFERDLKRASAVRLSDLNPPAIGGRLALGYAKLIVGAPLVHQLYELILKSDVPSAVRLACAASVFMLWIYVNFSGYMDIVIGVGRLFGFDPPENFDRPDRAVSFLDIWHRWHITLSKTFQAYVFNPLLRLAHEHLGAGSLVPAGLAATAVVFFLIGWWHGPEAKFALSGLALAVCAVVNRVWQSLKPLRNVQLSPMARQVISGGAGLGACALALVPTWPLFQSAGEVLTFYRSPQRVLTALAIATLIGIAVRLAGLGLDALKARTSIAPLAQKLNGHPVLVGATAAALLLIVWSASEQFSAIVYYQRF